MHQGVSGCPPGLMQRHPNPPPAHRNPEADTLPGALCTFGDRYFPISSVKCRPLRDGLKGTSWQSLAGSTWQGKGGVVVKEAYKSTCFSTWLWPWPHVCFPTDR